MLPVCLSSHWLNTCCLSGWLNQCTETVCFDVKKRCYWIGWCCDWLDITCTNACAFRAPNTYYLPRVQYSIVKHIAYISLHHSSRQMNWTTGYNRRLSQPNQHFVQGSDLFPTISCNLGIQDEVNRDAMLYIQYLLDIIIQIKK